MIFRSGTTSTFPFFAHTVLQNVTERPGTVIVRECQGMGGKPFLWDCSSGG